MLTKLYTFGCSYTYGQGLADCIMYPGTKKIGLMPSKLGWPALVAADLGYDLVNMSLPGNSNRAIMNTISYEVKNLDSDGIVIIHWTHKNREHRYVEFENNDAYSFVNGRETAYVSSSDQWRGNLSPLLTWEANQASAAYYEHIYSDFHAMLVTRQIIDYVDLKLKQYGIRVLHLGPVGHRKDDGFHELPHFYDTREINIDPKHLKCFEIDVAHDNTHPGDQSNINFSKYILENHGEYLRGKHNTKERQI